MSRQGTCSGIAKESRSRDSYPHTLGNSVANCKCAYLSHMVAGGQARCSNDSHPLNQIIKPTRTVIAIRAPQGVRVTARYRLAGDGLSLHVKTGHLHNSQGRETATFRPWATVLLPQVYSQYFLTGRLGCQGQARSINSHSLIQIIGPTRTAIMPRAP